LLRFAPTINLTRSFLPVISYGSFFLVLSRLGGFRSTGFTTFEHSIFFNIYNIKLLDLSLKKHLPEKLIIVTTIILLVSNAENYSIAINQLELIFQMREVS